MPFFSKVFRSKDSAKKQSKENGFAHQGPPKPRWDDAWQRQNVEPEEVQELLRGCTQEIKTRGLDLPFLLLPFRPASDPSAARSFIRNYFGNGTEVNRKLQGDGLIQELRLVEPMVLCSVLKWCWSRLTGGVVTWEAYELFRIGEQDSNQARDAFSTFIPISVASDARTKIIFDFFDILSAIAAHGKVNGLGGIKLSRFAGWWAFEHSENTKGFDTGYRTWEKAADATSHLFFAYLRSLSPDSVQGKNGISSIPRSLQHLLANTAYPPTLLPHKATSKVVMIVENVSPTPFALLRRAKNFEYRDEDAILRRFSDYDDPVKALTDECRRVLKSISSANDSSTSKASTSIKDASWSRFEDIGFGGIGEDSDDDGLNVSQMGTMRQTQSPTFGTARSRNQDTNGGRPTTPSWADFLSSGFVDDAEHGGPTLLLPPDKVLPPINTRGQSSQSHRRMDDNDSLLEPGELASITSFELDDTFWWVWITSLAGEESLKRKAVFGRCALIETRINNGTWLLVEEIVKGAAPEPDANAYVAEKKSRFGFSKRGKLSRSKSTAKGTLSKSDGPGTGRVGTLSTQPSKTSIAPDQHARIQAAAAALQQKHQREEFEGASPRRARLTEDAATKTTSSATLQPLIISEATPAMKWANSYDKNTIRAKYLGNNQAGKGSSATDLSRKELPTPQSPSGPESHKNLTALEQASNQPLPPTPINENSTPLQSPAQPTNGNQTYPRAMEKADAPPPPPPPPPPTKDAPEPTKNENGNAGGNAGGLKKTPSNAFKGLFNRKKEDQAPSKLPPKPIHASSSAVAAAKAALEAKAAQSQSASPPPANRVVNKRYSTVGKGIVEDPAAESTSANDRPVSTVETEYTEASTVDPAEQRQADKAFDSFDQGPLGDQPAFVPEESPRPSDVREENIQSKETLEQRNGDPVSQTSTEPEATAGNKRLSNDRWAQIRKDAAERANRVSEDQSGQTDKTDDGETSGEETIESRVARIKARVAELTGGMENEGRTRA